MVWECSIKLSEMQEYIESVKDTNAMNETPQSLSDEQNVASDDKDHEDVVNNSESSDNDDEEEAEEGKKEDDSDSMDMIPTEVVTTINKPSKEESSDEGM